MAERQGISNLRGRTGPCPREDAILEAVRVKLREAYQNAAVGELFVRFVFHQGGLRSQRVGMKMEYEFVEDGVV